MPSGARHGAPVDSQAFYDDYVSRQVRVGINERHRAVMDWLRRAGLRGHQRVLEVGCGVGTLTRLLAEELSDGGSALAIDLSPKSIEAAQKALRDFLNVELRVGNVLDAELAERFDVIVLPDVIEHIPLEDHSALFGRIAHWLNDDGFALLNYPNPHYLQWCRDNKPEVLQAIDQPISARDLCMNAYPAGLYLDFLKTYSIWVREGDYVVAVLKPVAGVNDFSDLPEPRPSLLARARFKWRQLRDR